MREFALGNVRLNPEDAMLSCTNNGKSVRLAAKEYHLMELFLRNPHQLLPKETILEHAWGFDNEAEYNKSVGLSDLSAAQAGLCRRACGNSRFPRAGLYAGGNIMIVRLRKRLTLAAIAALILIFAVTVAAINLANAWSLRGQISQSLQMLMGSYIPPSEREKVFDRFYRAESAAQTQGSGIGLAIARCIAALHHGDICLESDEASGTAFIVTLPEDAK